LELGPLLTMLNHMEGVRTVRLRNDIKFL
jgi:hypothetical protein